MIASLPTSTRLCSSPASTPKPDGRFHRTLAKRFPFAIYYEVQGDIATVVAILDCRQNPASITERLRGSLTGIDTDVRREDDRV